MTDAIVSLRQHLPQLSASERRVAEVVISRPFTVVEKTITELAEFCETSAGTVARMCRAIGFSGYKELRIAIAGVQGRERPAEGVFRVSEAEIVASDSLADVVAKVANQQLRAIEDTARLVDLEALDAVVQALRTSSRIDLFGVGASGLAATDLQIKLQRIGVPSMYWADAHIALTAAATASESTVAIAISYSGDTREATEFLSIARAQGAMTVAITDFPGSPLAKQARWVLTTAGNEGPLRAGATASRLAQMAVVDFLFVRLVQQDVAVNDALLRTTYEAVGGHRNTRR